MYAISISLCHRLSEHLKTLPFVVNRFFGMIGGSSFRVVLSTTNTTLEGWPMSSSTFRSGRRKTPCLLVNLHHPWTGIFSTSFSLFSPPQPSRQPKSHLGVSKRPRFLSAFLALCILFHQSRFQAHDHGSSFHAGGAAAGTEGIVLVPVDDPQPGGPAHGYLGPRCHTVPPFGKAVKSQIAILDCVPCTAHTGKSVKAFF